MLVNILVTLAAVVTFCVGLEQWFSKGSPSDWVKPTFRLASAIVGISICTVAIWAVVAAWRSSL